MFISLWQDYGNTFCLPTQSVTSQCRHFCCLSHTLFHQKRSLSSFFFLGQCLAAFFIQLYIKKKQEEQTKSSKILASTITFRSRKFFAIFLKVFPYRHQCFPSEILDRHFPLLRQLNTKPRTENREPKKKKKTFLIPYFHQTLSNAQNQKDQA